MSVIEDTMKSEFELGSQLSQKANRYSPYLIDVGMTSVTMLSRVAEVAQGHGGRPRRKVWTRTKNLSPNIRYFVANLDLSRYTHFFLEIFGQKKCLFG